MIDDILKNFAQGISDGINIANQTQKQFNKRLNKECADMTCRCINCNKQPPSRFFDDDDDNSKCDSCLSMMEDLNEY